MTRYINQTQPPPIDNHFISLGTYDFLVGEWEAVVISNKGTTQHVIVDAVQFLPQVAPAKAGTATKPSPKPEGKPAQAMLKKMEAELKALKQAAITQPQIIAAAEGNKPGDISIAIRGNVHNAGARTPRSFIQVLNRESAPKIAPKDSGRTELANWLASEEHPLTARVFVNRMWHHLFGEGIVPSVDNFGHSGRLPTNQPLLDHLATRFVDGGWSTKKLIREILLSRVYQLSSHTAPTMHTQSIVDFENKLFWRQNRRRLQAEAIRDAVLFVSGGLDSTLGGNTIKPGTTTEYGYQFEDTRRTYRCFAIHHWKFWQSSILRIPISWWAAAPRAVCQHRRCT